LSAAPADVGPMPPAAVAPCAQLTAALQGWQQRLNAAGISTRAVALHSAQADWSCAFPGADQALSEAWALLRERISPENPVALSRLDASARADMVVASSVQLPSGALAVVGVCLAPPHSDKLIGLLMLSLGWLQLVLSSQLMAQNQHATRLLELLGHVGSQTDARSAAQEWVNRTAAWARAQDAGVGNLALTLFAVRRGQPRWWVGADTAWAEQASAGVHEASEVASRAAVQMREWTHAGWWALPVLDDGEPVAVLVAQTDAAVFAAPVLAVLRASVGLAEPLLRHWREAGRSLPLHAVQAAQAAWRKLSGPGHLTWKFAALAVVLVLGMLLFWPVPDRVTAPVVIEGRVRQVMTAPFDGFIAQALVRPGEHVVRGQMMAKLDDRELKLEQGRYRSERDQAAGKQRQAMAEHDAAAVALALTEVQQAQAQLALVEAKLARAELVAPMDGVVVSGDWVQQLGSPLETGKELFEIASLAGYRVVLHVPDSHITEVHAGQTGALRLTGLPQHSYAFTIATVTATASVQDGSNGFRVEATWDGSPPPLSPGMQGVGKITVGSANLWTVWTRPSVNWLLLKWWSWWW
jgi:multidrug resistance efflux pump